MFFGKFLIQKNIITEEQLLTASIEQLKSQPSAIEVLKNAFDFNTSQLLDIVEKSVLSSKSIFECINLNNDQKDIYIKYLYTNSESLGQCLVKLEYISSDELGVQLKDYIGSGHSLNNIEKSENTSATISNDSSSDDVGISNAALDSLKELGLDNIDEIKELESKLSDSDNKSSDVAVNSAALESLNELGIQYDSQDLTNEPDKSSIKESNYESEFLKFFTEDTFNGLIVLTKSLAKGFDASIIKDLHQTVSEILGYSTIEDLEELTRLFHSYQKVLEAVLDDSCDFTQINFLTFTSALKEGFSIAWEIRQGLCETFSEEKVFEKKSDLKTRYVTNLKKSISVVRGDA